jgi:hypothetical protein
MLKLIFSALLLCAGASALAIEKITLWPTVLFVRGQDLCQYQDAFGQSRNDLTAQATNQPTQGLGASGCGLERRDRDFAHRGRLD